MIVQFLDVKSERNQHLLMILIFVIFIFYSCYTAFNLSLFLVVSVLIICSLGVIFLIKKQLKNKTNIQPQIYIQIVKREVIKRNLKWVVFPILIYAVLTILHFYILYIADLSLMPLVYDYGLGGLLALALNVYTSKYFYFGICDHGLILGSKFDSKLIKWESLEKVKSTNENIGIILANNFPIETLSFKKEGKFLEVEKLLKYKGF